MVLLSSMSTSLLVMLLRGAACSLPAGVNGQTLENTVERILKPKASTTSTKAPTGAPTTTSPFSNYPTEAPSVYPTKTPKAPTGPARIKSAKSSKAPSMVPSEAPSMVPSMAPSDSPSTAPSESPSDVPSLNPSGSPSMVPSMIPSDSPSESPSTTPSKAPSDTPSMNPSGSPSMVPSESMPPSQDPSTEPSKSPTMMPSMSPSTCAAKEIPPGTVLNTQFVASVQDTPGTCTPTSTTWWCSGDDLKFLNCYQASDFGVSPPFAINSVRFWIDGDFSDLSIAVWVDEDVVGGLPGGNPTVEQSITGYTSGENTFSFSAAVASTCDVFCVGVHSAQGDGHMYVESGGASHYRCGTSSYYGAYQASSKSYCIEGLGVH